MKFNEKLDIFNSFISEAPSLKNISKLKKELGQWLEMEKQMNNEVIKRSTDPLKSKDKHDSLKGQMYKVREYINSLRDKLTSATA